jgi:hypothetical protein
MYVCMYVCRCEIVEMLKMRLAICFAVWFVQHWVTHGRSIDSDV